MVRAFIIMALITISNRMGLISKIGCLLHRPLSYRKIVFQTTFIYMAVVKREILEPLLLSCLLTYISLWLDIGMLIVGHHLKRLT